MSTGSARELIRNAVLTLVREAGIGRRPLIPSEPDGPAVPEPDPLAGVTAARELEWAARDAVRRHAQHARTTGRTWAQIGRALGYERVPHPERTPAEAAFRDLASDLGGGPSFAWTCPDCLQVITEYDPENGHPADRERGHDGGCARMAREIRQYEAEWGDGND